jgi:hypothetical protein
MDYHKLIMKFIESRSRALCWGDPRFTGDKPDKETQKNLSLICKECEMFFECLEWAETFQVEDGPAGAVEVFAAGEWRE